MAIEYKRLVRARERALAVSMGEFVLAVGSFMETFAVGQDPLPIWGRVAAGVLTVVLVAKGFGNLRKFDDIEGYIEKEKKVVKEPMPKRFGRFALGRPLNLTVRV